MQKGFTLIELMITIIIIGLLAVIAIPFYQNYMTKSHVTAALHEISTGKSAYELAVNHTRQAVNIPEDISLPTNTYLCEISVHNIDDRGIAVKAIVCTLKSTAALETGAEIYISRSSDGIYSCGTTAIPVKYRPNGCS
ncbi:pilin [Acinetobacter radioresistens]